MTRATGHRGTSDIGGATVTTVRVLGVLAAFTGVEHGIGEISQGPVAPPALVFESWPHVAAFEPLNGEPAMSLVPNLLISGVLSALVALVLGAVAFCHPHRGRLLIRLSLLLLLVGGGFGPPLLGVLAGLLATRDGAHRPDNGPRPTTRFGAGLWPWPLLAATGSFLALVPGTTLLYAASGSDLSALVAVLTLGAFTATALAMWTARARDRLTAGWEPAPSPTRCAGQRHPPGPAATLQALHPSRPATAAFHGDRRPRRIFRLWAALWSTIVSVLFLAVTALTLTLWATDPDYVETTPLTDLGFFALGAVIATGFLSQLRAHPPVTGVHQAALATVALAATGLLGRRIEPFLGALLILAALSVLAALHPARTMLLRLERPHGQPVSAALTALVVVVAVPAVWQATRLLDAAAAAGPSCFLGQCARGDRLAELAAALVTVVLVGLLAALQPAAARLPLWVAGAVAILIGAASAALPDVTGSLGMTGGAALIGWGGLFIAVGEHEHHHDGHQPPPEAPLASSRRRAGPDRERNLAETHHTRKDVR